MDFLIDGTATLAEQQATLLETEQLENMELVRLHKAAGVAQQNRASFLPVPLGQTISPLLLRAVTPTQDLVALIAEQLTQGHHLLFTATIFVAGSDTQVAAFR